MTTAGFVPPGHWTETAGQLKTSQSVVLNAAGTGALSFDPDHANQRWVVTNVTVSTNQASTAVVIPYATLAMNTVDITSMSQGNQRGTSWTGNNDQFKGALDVGPCDFMSVLFYPPPGATAGQIAALAGVIATAVVTGTRYTRRN
jgi:hypothetical protein